MHEQGADELDPRDATGDRLLGTELGVLGERGVQLGEADPTRAQRLAIALLAQIGLRREEPARRQQGLVERLILEGVQRIVVDEHVQWPLPGQQMGQVVDELGDRSIGVEIGLHRHRHPVRRCRAPKRRASDHSLIYHSASGNAIEFDRAR